MQLLDGGVGVLRMMMVVVEPLNPKSMFPNWGIYQSHARTRHQVLCIYKNDWTVLQSISVFLY